MKISRKLQKWILILGSTLTMAILSLSKGVTPLAISVTFFFFALFFIWYDWCSE